MTGPPLSGSPVLARLRELAPPDAGDIEEPGGHLVIQIEARRLKPFMAGLRDDDLLGPSLLSDLTVVDRFAARPRFQVIYHLRWTDWLKRLRVVVGLDDGRDVDSLVGIWPGADWLEREVFDLFGIRFSGHPGLKRILLPEDFEGYPLRRDFDSGDSKIRWPEDPPGGEN